MKRISKVFTLLLIVLSLTFSPSMGQEKKSKQRKTSYSTTYKKPAKAKTVRVKGYTKKNGTYVKPHYRSKPSKRSR